MLNTGIVRDSMLSNSPHFTVGLSDIAIFENYILTTLYPNAHFLEQIAVFNDSLELIKLDPLRDSFRTVYGHSQFVTTKNKLPKIYSLTARWNDSVFFPPPYSYWHKNLSIIHMDTTFSFTAIDTFQHNRNIDDTIGWTTPYAHFGSIDWNTNGDTAVFMGTNFEFWDPHFITKTNASTFVHCVNSNNGNQHWAKTFSNGYSHLAHSVIRLPGNKHLLVFNEYNWDKYPGENLAIHLILIDEYGNPIGINEQEEEALLREPVVFPNPASHLLWVKNLFWSGNSYHYYLNDLSGKTVQKGKLAKGEPITLKEELRGIYVLSIVNQTGFGWARKILIN